MNNFQYIEKLRNEIIDYDFLHYDKVDKINIFSIFSINNNIKYIKKNKFDISNNILESNKLIKFIIDNKNHNNINFKFKCLYKYCFNINYQDILNFDFSNNYYCKVDIFKDIYFQDTIKYYNTFNSILIIYNKNTNCFKTLKKKSYFNKTKKL